MSNKILYSLLVLSIMILPGCGRLIDWGTSRLYQGNTFKVDLNAVREHIRWATVYDQFTTAAMFDALWLSTFVRTTFTQEHAFREEKSSEHYKAALRRQLEEINHVIAFYVLSIHEISLGDPASEWAVFLIIDGKKLDPIEVKTVDLPYEYQIFFGNRLTQFKDSYSIKFNAKDLDEKIYLNSDRHTMQLCFRKFDKEVILEWKIDSSGLLVSERVSGGVPILQSRDQIVKYNYNDPIE